MVCTSTSSQNGDVQTEQNNDNSKPRFTMHESNLQDESHKRKAGSGGEPPEKESDTVRPSSPKRPKKFKSGLDTASRSPSTPADTKTSNSNPIIGKLLSSDENLPLQDLGISDPENRTPSNMLAHVLNAMLTSARISHELATKSVKCLIEANYHDLETLKKSSWEERTEVLTKGGYTRYREKTATGLGELAEFIEDKYGMRKPLYTNSVDLPINTIVDGDLNNILTKTDSSPAKIRSAIKEIKGIGDVGVNILFDTAQAAWPCLAPFIDPRSLETAENFGMGNDVGKLYEDVGEDPVKMCKLAAALTIVRLEKRESDFT